MLFKTCESEPQLDERNNVISQNCLRCKDNYYFMNGTKDCYNDSVKEQGYYLSSNDLNDQKYYKCDIQCKTCYEKNVCIKCNEEKNIILYMEKTLLIVIIMNQWAKDMF